jgi:hypothetical protein
MARSLRVFSGSPSLWRSGPKKGLEGVGMTSSFSRVMFAERSRIQFSFSMIRRVAITTAEENDNDQDYLREEEATRTRLSIRNMIAMPNQSHIIQLFS